MLCFVVLNPPAVLDGSVVLKGSTHLSPVPALQFLARVGFSTPAARRFSSNIAYSRSRAFRGEIQPRKSSAGGSRTPDLPLTETLKSPVRPLGRRVETLFPSRLGFPGRETAERPWWFPGGRPRSRPLWFPGGKPTRPWMQAFRKGATTPRASAVASHLQ